jgi:hypothetical protein
VNTLKPSNFVSRPWNSIAKKSESETIARNIMVIRKRLGDKWELTWEEYERERKADKGRPEGEKYLFDEVYPLISDVIGAVSFSPDWAAAAREAIANKE